MDVRSIDACKFKSLNVLIISASSSLGCTTTVRCIATRCTAAADPHCTRHRSSVTNPMMAVCISVCFLTCSSELVRTVGRDKQGRQIAVPKVNRCMFVIVEIINCLTACLLASCWHLFRAIVGSVDITRTGSIWFRRRKSIDWYR
jgi:hypothetical protein